MDLFVYGLDEKEATEKVRHIYAAVKRANSKVKKPPRDAAWFITRKFYLSLNFLSVQYFPENRKQTDRQTRKQTIRPAFNSITKHNEKSRKQSLPSRLPTREITGGTNSHRPTILFSLARGCCCVKRCSTASLVNR